MRKPVLVFLVLTALCLAAAGTPCTLLEGWVGVGAGSADAGALLADVAELHRSGVVEGWAVLQALAPLARQAHERLNCSVAVRGTSQPQMVVNGVDVKSAPAVISQADSSLKLSPWPENRGTEQSQLLHLSRPSDASSVSVAPPLSRGAKSVSVSYRSNNDCDVLLELHVRTMNTSFANSSCLENCCTCPGVNCSAEGMVTSVSVYPAAGTIPASIWSLQSLQVLRVVGIEYGILNDEDLLFFVAMSGAFTTSVSGSFLFPPTLPTNLSDLIIYGSFSGEILFHPKRLRRLQLAGSFTGPVPVMAMQEVSESLQMVGSFSSGLSKTVFQESLQYLSIEGATGGVISELVPFPPSLVVVDLFGCLLTGTIPPSLRDLTSLTVLNLGSNALVGGIPPWMGNLTCLTYLSLFSNYLTGSVPESLGNLTNLRQLWLRSNELTGIIPDALGNLTDLTILALDANQLIGSIPEALGNLGNLTHLNLHSNQLSGSIPETFGNLLSLQTLQLYSNELTGSIPDSLGMLASLSSLLLSSNQLSGNIPVSIERLTSLKNLDLSSNRLTGSISGSVAKFSQLVTFDVHNNILSGPIPDVFCLLPKLQVLLLSQNNFSVFPFCSNSPSWIIVDVSTNVLVDFPFLAALSWPNLVALDVSHNRLSGPFPVVPVNTSLRTLSLAFNNLTGNFPIGPCGSYETAYYTLPTVGLSYLDVSGNKISGFFFADRHQCGTHCGNKYFTLSSVVMAECGLTSLVLDPSYTSCYSHTTTPIGRFLALFPSLQSVDLSGNEIEGTLDDLFSIGSLSSLNLQNNPATLNNTLSFSLRQGIRFDAASLFPYSANMSCYQAIFGNNLRVEVEPLFFSYFNCQCRPGYYGKPPDCIPCAGSLNNAHCSFESDDVAASFMLDPAAAWNASGNIIANDGYYATPAFTYQEMTENVGYPVFIQPCRGTGTEETPCKSSPDGPCKEGYNGRLCTACTGSYFLAGESCYKCPTGGALAAFAVFVIFLVILLFAWSLFISSSASGVLKILMLFLQGLFYIHVPMPKGLNFVQSAGESAFVVELAGPECFFSDWSFEKSYLVSVLTPWVTAMIVACIWTVGRLVLHLCRGDVEQRKRWTDRCRRSAVFFLLFTYMGTTKTILTPMACQEDPGDRQSYMIALPYHRCSSSMTAVSSLLFVCYVVGLPAVLTWVVAHSGVLKKGPTTRRNFVLALLFESYHPKAYFWELISTVRRVLFALAFAAVEDRSAVRSFLVMAVLGCTMILQGIIRPFHETSENILEMFEVANLAINYAIAIKSQAIGTTDSQEVGILLFVINISLVLLSVLVLLSGKIRDALNRVRGKSVAEKHERGHGHSHRGIGFRDQELTETLVHAHGSMSSSPAM